MYIGKTIYSIEHRFKEHIKDAYNHKCNSKLHRAILKYGEEHFYSVLLEKCLEIEAGEKEKYYIQLYDAVKNGYNISYGGEGESQVNIEILKKLATQGYSFNEIAQITNHSKKTVSVRLRNLGYKSPYNNISGYKDKGIKIKWNEIEFNSYTLLAKYLKENIEIFKDKKIATIIKGISKNIKLHKKYCGYNFQLSASNPNG